MKEKKEKVEIYRIQRESDGYRMLLSDEWRAYDRQFSGNELQIPKTSDTHSKSLRRF